MTALANHPGDCAAAVGMPCRVCEVARRPEYRRVLSTLAAPTDCLHRGEATGAVVACREGCRGTRLKVFACAIHGAATIDKRGEGVPGKCKGCTERTLLPVPALLPGLPDPLPVGELATAPAGWAHEPAVQARHARAFRALLASLSADNDVSPGSAGDVSPGPASATVAPLAAAGDGIVLCGGGRYWPMVCLAVRMARDVTDLPIQIWHRGAAEPIEPADLADVPGVRIVDASAYDCRILRGWETKALALVHCGFERVLYLDADAYLVADPRPWLESCTPAEPFVFWQDLPAQNGRVRWLGWGMNDPRIPPVQGGQLAIHRRAAWRELVLFHWANQHSDYYYQHGFGDQDCWPPVLALADTDYRCLGMSPWQWPAYVLPWDGKPLIVHRCRGKLFGTSADKYEPDLPGEARLWEHRARHLDGRKAVPSVADWRAARLRALAREERCDAPGGAGAGNRVGGLLELIAAVSSACSGDRSPGPGGGAGLRVLEIGSYKGVSSEAFALTCAALTCVDPWDDDAAYQAFRARMGGYPHVRAVRGASPVALTAMPPASFDLVYIDAVHAAAELTADIRAAWRVVRPGGWLAGHDFGGPLGEVTGTVRALLGEPRVFADTSWLVRRPEAMPEAMP